MPFIKRTLSRSEIQLYSESVRLLKASGIEIDIPEAWRHSSAKPKANLEIELASGSDHSIQEFESGTGYVLDVDITNHSGSTLYPVDTILKLPWIDDLIHWLDVEEIPVRSRTKKTTYHECYRLDVRRRIDFPREGVINHILLLENARGLVPGRPVCGKLLARGGPLPEHVKNGQHVPVTLIIKCSDYSEYSQTLDLRVDRLLKRPRPPVRTHDLRGNPLPVPKVIDGALRLRPTGSRAENRPADRGNNVRRRNN